MRDYTKELPVHTEQYLGEHDLFLETFAPRNFTEEAERRPPLLFVHGAFTGSWMWSKYLPHFMENGWTCHAINLRSHYKSRQMDLTRITLEDYLEDIREGIAACSAPPVLIGFSMGGILGQKLAESVELAGLVLIDSVISREVHELAPYPGREQPPSGLVVPAPAREERVSVDETEEDIAFQRKYLAMESSKAFRTFIFSDESNGVSINSSLITCPCLVIKAVNDADDERRGKVSAELLRAEYKGLRNTTHTGILVGRRYLESVEAVLEWLERMVDRKPYAPS